MLKIRNSGMMSLMNEPLAIDTKMLKKICEVGNGLITIHQVPCLVADRNSFSRTYRIRAIKGRSRLVAESLRFQAKTKFLCSNLEAQNIIFEYCLHPMMA